MRILKRILSILFVIVFILSVALNIVLGSSSTYKILLGSKLEARSNLYYRSFYANNNAMLKNGFILTSTYTPSGETDYTVVETVACTKELECTMMGKRYLKETNELVRTSYFPRDGYKYYIENDEQKKVAYSNDDLNLHTQQTVSTFLSFIRYLVRDMNDISFEYTYNSKLRLDFNTLSLYRDVSVKADGSSTIDYTLSFASNDTLKKVTANGSNSATLEIDYKKNSNSFPNFSKYVEVSE